MNTTPQARIKAITPLGTFFSDWEPDVNRAHSIARAIPEGTFLRLGNMYLQRELIQRSVIVVETDERK